MEKNLTITPEDAKDYVISYHTLLIAVGILGIALPLILAIGHIILDDKVEILNSISSYAHTKMGNGFVGIMCAVALFMFSYLGHDKQDNIAGHLAGIFALGIAFFPNNTSDPLMVRNIIHLCSALLFFSTLIYFSLCLFTQTDQEVISAQKKNRNMVYKICAYVMIVCIALITVYMAFLKGKISWLDWIKPVFWLESFALLAFGISWITKGQFIYKD